MSVAKRCASLSPVLRRSVAVLLVPSLLAIAVLVIYSPIAEMQSAQQRWRTDVKQLLSQAAQAPARQAELQRELDSMRQSALWSKFYAAGGSMPAAPALQADVRAVLSAVQAGSQLLTAIPAEELPTFVRHGVRVTASLRVNQLQQVLGAMAAHPKYLQVGRLTVVAPQVQTLQENPPLAVTMEIYGYELTRDTRKSDGIAVASAVEARP